MSNINNNNEDEILKNLSDALEKEISSQTNNNKTDCICKGKCLKNCYCKKSEKICTTSCQCNKNLCKNLIIN